MAVGGGTGVLVGGGTGVDVGSGTGVLVGTGVGQATQVPCCSNVVLVDPPYCCTSLDIEPSLIKNTPP